MPNGVDTTEGKSTVPSETPQLNTRKGSGWGPIPAILWTVFLYIAPQVAAVSILVSILAGMGWSSERVTDWLQGVVSAQFYYVLLAELLTLGGIYWLLRVRGQKMANLGLVRLRAGDVWSAIKWFAAYMVIYIAVVSFLDALIPSLNVEQEQQIGFETARSSTELLLVFASLVILPPLAEEIVFRGYLFSSLRSKLRFTYATLVTSVLFGVAHLQFGSGEPLLWIAAIDTAVLSVVLCYVRETTGSLWPSIFIHAMKNMVAFVYLFIFQIT